MILDTRDNMRHYAPLFRGIDPTLLFDWLPGARGIESGGKVNLEGEKLFARVMRQDTAPRDACRWEAHREYVDLQYILGGGEIIEWAAAVKLVADRPYDDAADLQFYADAPADVLLPMREGLFVFLFPDDAHKPCVADGRNGFVHKVVVKIHRSLLAI